MTSKNPILATDPPNARLLAAPHNLEMERSVLSRMMRDAKFASMCIAKGLRSTHFFDTHTHGRIYSAICEAYERVKLVDDTKECVWHVCDILRKKKPMGEEGRSDLELVGGAAPIMAIFDLVDFETIPEKYIDEIKLYADARTLLPELERSGAEIRNCALYELADTLQGIRARLLTAPAERVGALRIHKVIGEMHVGETPTAIPTGFKRLDALTGPMSPGLTTVAGSYGVGKTSFAASVALQMSQSEEKVGVLWFSLDATRKFMTKSLIHALARVDSNLLPRDLNVEEAGRLEVASKSLASLPIWVDDRRGLLPSQIESMIFSVQEEAKRSGLRLIVVVDHLQLVKVERGDQEAPWQLADIAVRLGVPMIGISTLIERYRSKKSGEGEAMLHDAPQLVDVLPAVREASSRVILVHNYAATHRSETFFDGVPPTPEPERVVLIVARNKQGGGIGRVEMSFLPHLGLLEDRLHEVSSPVADTGEASSAIDPDEPAFND